MIAGTVVADRYRLDRKLGEGGMGAVWAATHVVTRKVVAIKMLRPELAHNAGLVERFLREARAACAVRHPHVVQIHDVLQLPQGAPIMVMDLLEGESLGERLLREGRLPVPEFSRIMVQVVSAVAAAHAAQVVHRDLKPDNLFLASSSDGALDVKVLDFGIAKVATTDQESGVLTKTGSMLGTPFYMAPEQLFGEKDIDHRVDIWSLGIIAWECLAGRRPTEADNLGQIIKVVTTLGIQPLELVASHVPADICDVVRRMLTSDRNARLRDLTEVRAVFGRYAGVPVSNPPGPAVGSRPPHAASDRIMIQSDPPAARTGQMHWAATQAATPTPVASRRRAIGIALALVLGLLAVTGILVQRFRARSALVAAVPSTLPPASTPSWEPLVPTTAASLTTEALPSAAPSLAASAPVGRIAAKDASPPRGADPRGAAPPPQSSAVARPPAGPPPAQSSLLVDKPPF